MVRVSVRVTKFRNYDCLVMPGMMYDAKGCVRTLLCLVVVVAFVVVDVFAVVAVLPLPCLALQCVGYLICVLPFRLSLSLLDFPSFFVTSR